MEGFDTTAAVQAILRWAHIVAGILWIGHLYFFNFVNGPFEGTLDKDTKGKVLPELRPRALFWFRWGAAWTWITGFLLAGLVFYMAKSALFEMPADGTAPAWGAASGIMVLLTFAAPFLYDPLAKSGLGKNNQTFAIVGFVLTAAMLYAYLEVARFSYRGALIHVGALFGTLMAFNVWFRIWPLQQKIIAAIKAGQAPDAAWVATAGGRSRHNTYMSVPLVWAMMNQHSVTLSGFIYPGVSTLLATALGWLFVQWCYKKAAAVKGF